MHPRTMHCSKPQAMQRLVSNEKKMNLNITISTSPLGQQGMRGSEPFYIKGQGRVDNLGDDED